MAAVTDEAVRLGWLLGSRCVTIMLTGCLSHSAVQVSGDFESAALSLREVVVAASNMGPPVPEDIREDCLHLQGQLRRLNFEVQYLALCGDNCLSITA